MFENLKAVLNPGGTLLGCTILNRVAERNPLARLTLYFMNARGHMSNKQDDLEGLKLNLAESFSENSVKVVGCVALFSARK